MDSPFLAALFQWLAPFLSFYGLTPVSMPAAFNFVEGCAVLASLFECLRRLNVLRPFLRFAV